MVQFYVKLYTISAAKLFALEANRINGPVYIKYNDQLIDGKSINELSKLDLHMVLTVVIYDDTNIINMFKMSISEYIVNPRSTLDDSSSTN